MKASHDAVNAIGKVSPYSPHNIKLNNANYAEPI